MNLPIIKKKKQPIHYVDNKRLYTEMVKYITALNEAKELDIPKEKYPRVPEYVGYAISKIAKRLSTKPNFIGYTFREEMEGDAIENCLMYIHNFNPDKSKNPFAYFTQIMYFAFIRRIQKEQKQQYIKQKSMIESITMNTLVDMSAEDGAHFTAMNSQLDFNMDKYSDFIDKFEKSNKIKKKPKKGIEKFIDEDEDK